MTDPLGVPAGSISELNYDNLKNEYATIADQSLEAVSTRVDPVQVTSGVARGTQRIQNTDGSYVTLGQIPDNSGDFGIAFFNAKGKLISKSTNTTDFKYDNDGNLLFKADGTTEYRYDPSGSLIFKQDVTTQYLYDKATGKNILQIGKLPDGTYGFAVANSGYNVADGF